MGLLNDIEKLVQKTKAGMNSPTVRRLQQVANRFGQMDDESMYAPAASVQFPPLQRTSAPGSTLNSFVQLLANSPYGRYLRIGGGPLLGLLSM